MSARRSASSGTRSNSRDAMQTTTLATLKPDPANCRRHTPRNVGLIETALREVGAARSIVIDEDGAVLAGNATIEAAAAAGIERVQVIDADGETIVAVRRTGLTPEQKARLALYDNRAAELAEWDEQAVAALLARMPDVAEGLWTADELQALVDAASSGPMTPEEARQRLVDRFIVPPFSVLDARQGYWQDRKRVWLALGIQSELGRGDTALSGGHNLYSGSTPWAGNRGPRVGGPAARRRRRGHAHAAT